ncbi:hypothetical protein L1887_23853 [Cichorium endivia]|nr:hypothetical protein L1887_23853 [Cichorium endivia]
MKISRKRKNVIPIGKVVGGYKKAHKHQHKDGGLKKKSRGKKSIAKAVVEDDNAKEVEVGGSDDNDSIAGLLDRKSPGSDRRSQIEFESNIDNFFSLAFLSLNTNPSTDNDEEPSMMATGRKMEARNSIEIAQNQQRIIEFILLRSAA